ncbi:MAG: hypothetical protein ABWY11_22385 [Umezawaea sp.]
MAENNPDDLRRLAEMLHPWETERLRNLLFSWLQRGHKVARGLQAERDDETGDWRNDTSFATDRYQYLMHTARSVWDPPEDLRVDPEADPFLLKFPTVTIYPFRVAPDPHHPIPGITDLGRALLAREEPSPEHHDALALLSLQEVFMDDRDFLLLPWAGMEDPGCTGMWVGQGQLSDDGTMEWTWLVCLADGTEGTPD